MNSVFSRIYKITRSYSKSYLGQLFNDRFKIKQHDPDEFSQENAKNNSYNKSSKEKNNNNYNPQVVDDLAVFGLVSPSSFDKVKNARNREVKKYHSDKFVNDPLKYQISKEIMQTINASYERLKHFYNK